MLHKKRITFTVIRFFVVTWRSELLPPNPRASAVEGERIRCPPVGEISSNSFSNFKERAARWAVATIKFADRSSNLIELFLNRNERWRVRCASGHTRRGARA